MLRARPSPLRPGAERRRDKRYEVDLPGRVSGPALDGIEHKVMVSDLSGAGALVECQSGEPLAVGTIVTLHLDDFGPIEARVVHAGAGFYGVAFLHPHLHRERLTNWLREEAGGL